MNRSGWPVSLINNFYKVTPERTIVLHDEIDLPTAKIKHKIGGGHAGHNGIRDIIARLGEKGFHRIRIGVDRPDNKEDVTAYVLGKFSAQQKITLDSTKEEIESIIQTIITNK
jgi:PTH1 family peptidyl-tRNA hydrolase